MKHILLFSLSLLFAIKTKGQIINIDSCGLDTKSILNKWEIGYFKRSIGTLQSMDLENKHFAFAYGDKGSAIITKKDYFERWGRKYFINKDSVANILIVLTPEEKVSSGGYDYVIISWSKIQISEKSRKKLIERVRLNSEIRL
ncbi:MAG: hypothetical protein KG003_03895 [Bacteroidetes bacterium]|nr:hypothetical protein [Bacteroidota bacterium]